MRRIARGPLWLLAASLAGLGPAGAAQEPAPSGSWNVDWGTDRCSLIRQDPSTPGNYLALEIIPGNYSPSLRLISRAWPRRVLSDPDRIRVSFEPQGTLLEGEPWREETESGPALILSEQPFDLYAALAAARSVRVASEGAVLFEIAVPVAERALAALRECEVATMRQWGIDPAAHAAVRVPPRGNLARFVRYTDYPSASLRRGRQGKVTFRLDLDREGRSTACQVLVSSGDPALDATTCRIMRERVRVEPARDADGNAVVAIWVSSITWRIMGRWP